MEVTVSTQMAKLMVKMEKKLWFKIFLVFHLISLD